MACRELQPLIKKSPSFQGVSRLLAALIAMRFTSESLSIRFGQQGWGLSAIPTLVRPRLSGVSSQAGHNSALKRPYSTPVSVS
jgi:hypothetical protein